MVEGELFGLLVAGVRASMRRRLAATVMAVAKQSYKLQETTLAGRHTQRGGGAQSSVPVSVSRGRVALPNNGGALREMPL